MTTNFLRASALSLCAAAALLAAPTLRAATYGIAMPEGEATPAAAVLADAAAHEGKTVKLAGRITRVCQKTGCWLALDADGEPLRVKTEHQFFVPKDASGDAVAHGTLRAVSAEDAAAPKRWELIADSVVIQP